jgi:hypothetical protein
VLLPRHHESPSRRSLSREGGGLWPISYDPLPEPLDWPCLVVPGRRRDTAGRRHGDRRLLRVDEVAVRELVPVPRLDEDTKRNPGSSSTSKKFVAKAA